MSEKGLWAMLIGQLFDEMEDILDTGGSYDVMVTTIFVGEFPWVVSSIVSEDTSHRHIYVYPMYQEYNKYE